LDRVLENESLLIDDPIPCFTMYGGRVELYYDDGPHTYFRFDEDGNRVNIDSATTILHIIDKSFALVPWATRLCVDTIRNGMFNEDGTLKTLATEELLALLEEARTKHKTRLEEAGDLGKLAHNALEDTIRYAIEHTGGYVRERINPPENPHALSCYNAAIAWMDRHNVRWLSTERKVYSLKWDVPGTTDGVCIVGNNCDDLACCRGRVFSNRKAIADWKSSNELRDEYAYQTVLYLEAYCEETGEEIEDRWVLRLAKTGDEFEPWYIPPEFIEADRQAFLAARDLHRSLKEIRERRSAERKEIKTLIRAKATLEREMAKEADRVARAALREQRKQERQALKAAQAAHYKELRSLGVPVVRAKALAYPPNQDTKLSTEEDTNE
jgi:hypothetical protein